jgi:hypothetical protein
MLLRILSVTEQFYYVYTKQVHPARGREGPEGE